MDAHHRDWLRDEDRTAAQHFNRQLGTADETNVRVPNLERSVAELGQHLAALPHRYDAQVEIGTSFTSPGPGVALSGKIIASGRQPWRPLEIGDAVVDGV
jgi:hypothetical protein